MSNYHTLLEEFRNISENPGPTIKEWKTKNPKGPVIGFFPVYVPQEIIIALGGLPVGIWGGTVSISTANAYIQQFTCSIVRSATEYAFNGTFDVLDAMVFPPTCDSVKLTAGLWAKNISDKFFVEFYSTPERQDSEATSPYVAAEAQRVLDSLKEQTGASYSDESLSEAIIICNEMRKLQEKLYSLRAKYSEKDLSFADVRAIIKSGTYLHPKDYNEKLSSLLDALYEEKGESTPSNLVPIAVTGLSCQIPHPAMMHEFEDAGLKVVDDDMFLGMRGIDPLDPSDPIRSLGDAYANAVPLSTRHNHQKSRFKYITNKMKESGAKGLIFLTPKFCEPELFDLRILKDAVRDASIPFLAVDFQEDSAQAGGVSTRLAAFAETF